MPRLRIWERLPEPSSAQGGVIGEAITENVTVLCGHQRQPAATVEAFDGPVRYVPAVPEPSGTCQAGGLMGYSTAMRDRDFHAAVEKGCRVQEHSQGTGYMDAATFAGGSERGGLSAARLFYRYNSDRPGWNCIGCGLKYIALDGQRTTKPRLCVSCTEYVSA